MKTITTIEDYKKELTLKNIKLERKTIMLKDMAKNLENCNKQIQLLESRIKEFNMKGVEGVAVDELQKKVKGMREANRIAVQRGRYKFRQETIKRMNDFEKQLDPLESNQPEGKYQSVDEMWSDFKNTLIQETEKFFSKEK